MGGRGSSSANAKASSKDSKLRDELLAFAETLETHYAIRDRERGALARVAAGLVGTDALEAIVSHELVSNVYRQFRWNNVLATDGVDRLISTQSGADRERTIRKVEQIERDLGITRQQLNAFYAFHVLLAHRWR